MPSWTDVTRLAPELSTAVQERFDAHGVALLATIRRDGSPRISGLEPLFAGGELWMGMMPSSRKSLDLRRDPRFALHTTIVDKKAVDGDARIRGEAVAIEDPDSVSHYLRAFEAANGYGPGTGSIDLYRAEISEIMFLRPEDGDHLAIRWWTEHGGLRSRDRY